MEKFNYIDLLGKKFEHNGRGPDKYDCYGLVKEIYQKLGVELPEYFVPDEPASISKAVDEGKKLFLQIDKPEKYCLVLFTTRPPFVSHIGVMLDDVRFIHISPGSQVSVERVDSIIWKSRIAGFYKWKN